MATHSRLGNYERLSAYGGIVACFRVAVPRSIAIPIPLPAKSRTVLAGVHRRP
jgi:hypothetical protein